MNHAFPNSLRALVDALKILPSVGNKSALRMALYLLERNPSGAELLSKTIQHALTTIRKCECCRNLTDETLCTICRDERRDRTKLCIVENPTDVFTLEQSIEYSGLYFVLMGNLSPLDGVGPSDIGLELLENHFKKGHISELILATNSTVEGEATAYYIDEMAKPYNIQVTRIAHGVPMGGELEYLDGNTLSHAFKTRHKF